MTELSRRDAILKAGAFAVSVGLLNIYEWTAHACGGSSTDKLQELLESQGMIVMPDNSWYFPSGCKFNLPIDVVEHEPMDDYDSRRGEETYRRGDEESDSGSVA